MSAKPRVLACLYVLLFALSALADDKPAARTAIIGALDAEVQLIQRRVKDSATQTFLGVKFTTGILDGRPVVVAKTGIGKVNAAATTALLLDHFRPSEVIFTGIAGAVDPALSPGDVVIATKTAHHDLGVVTTDGFSPKAIRNPTSGKQNPVFLLCDAALVRLSQEAAANVVLDAVPPTEGRRRPKVVAGVIVSGDVFVASAQKRSELRERFSADAVEMDGAAVAQVCYQQGVPFVILRGLSDKADQHAEADVERACQTAAKNAAELACRLVTLLAGEKEKTK
jgi:adenosylhomocysteine nucleosidase